MGRSLRGFRATYESGEILFNERPTTPVRVDARPSSYSMWRAGRMSAELKVTDDGIVALQVQDDWRVTHGGVSAEDDSHGETVACWTGYVSSISGLPTGAMQFTVTFTKLQVAGAAYDRHLSCNKDIYRTLTAVEDGSKVDIKVTDIPFQFDAMPQYDYNAPSVRDAEKISLRGAGRRSFNVVQA